MDNLRGVALTEAEAIDKIKEVCLDNEIEIEILERKGYCRNINLLKDGAIGMLRVHSNTKGKGLTLDRSSKDKTLNDFVLKCFIEKNTVKTVKNKTYSYKHISVTDYGKIKEEIIKFCIDTNSEIKNKEITSEGYIQEEYKIIEQENNESLNIQFYKNHTLKVDGLSWNLWEKICYIIEKQIKPNICDIVYRMTLESTVVSDTKVSDQIKESQKIVEAKLNQKVIEFIELHDYNLIVASELLLQSKVELPIYNSIIFPFFIASEGFFKKILIELGIVKSFEMTSKFTFGICFNKDLTLKDEYISCLCKEKKESQLEGLHLLMGQARIRNLFGHSTPGKPNQSIDNLTVCQDICGEVINVLNESYDKIF